MDSFRPTTIPTRGALRLVRGSLVGLAAVGVAITGHLAGGGAAPPLTLLGVLSVPSAVLAWWCSDRRWTGARLVGVLLAVQSLLHLAFTVSEAHPQHGNGVAMLLGHLVATAVTARLLAGGEAWLWDLLGALGLHIVGRVRSTPAPVLPRQLLVETGSPRRVALHLRSTPRRRGPPYVVRP